MRTILAGLTVFVTAVWPIEPADAEPSRNLVVIVHESCPIDVLSVAELRQIFTNNRAPHPSGSQWIALNAPPRSLERARFDRAVLRKSPDEVGRFWVDQKIRGRGRPPKVVPTAITAARIIQRLPNGITYVQSGQVPRGTKVVRLADGASL